MPTYPQFKVKKWTIQAAECYEYGCNCKICPLRFILETKCVMKKTVIELVKKFGAPDIETIKQTAPKGFTKY